jgi:hypothetical protein
MAGLRNILRATTEHGCFPDVYHWELGKKDIETLRLNEVPAALQSRTWNPSKTDL